jgi:hypothetical protein
MPADAVIRSARETQDHDADTARVYVADSTPNMLMIMDATQSARHVAAVEWWAWVDTSSRARSERRTWRSGAAVLAALNAGALADAALTAELEADAQTTDDLDDF